MRYVSGGILCPICFDEAKINLPDVIKVCGLSCLMVADAGLGTINGIGLTEAYMKSENIPLRGIIFNHFEPENLLHEDNLKICEYITGIKEVRIMGGCVCIEVYDPALLKGYQQFAYEKGVFSRPFLNYLYAMVPYVIEEPELVKILDTMKMWFE